MTPITLNRFFGDAFKRPKVAAPKPQEGATQMADIRVGITGKTFFQVDNTLAAILVEALPGQVQYVNVKPATPLPTTWTYSVAKMNSPTGLSAIRRTKGAQVEILPYNDPKEAQKAFPEIPEEVIAQFAAIPARDRVGGPVR